VPDNDTLDVLPRVELLLMVNCPVTVPVAVGANLTVRVAVDPGFNEIGKLPPTMEKPVPVAEAEETVTADVPVDESVTDAVVEAPTVTVPRLKLEAFSVSFGFGEVDPVPLSATIELAPVVELLLTVNCPLTVPAVVGAKVTCTVSDCPTARVMGRPLTTIENPVPVAERELIVTAAVPDDFKVTGSTLDVPSVMLPKLKVVALRVSCGVEVTPVPESATVDVGAVVELLPMVSLPVTAPAVLGAKVIGMANVCPGVRVLGNVVAAIENPVPVTERELIVTAVVPDDVKVTDSALDVPSVTFP